MGGMRHGRHRTTCLIKVFNTQVEESKAAVQIPELYFTGVTPEGCSGLCSTGQHSPTFSSATQGCLTVQNITHELTRSVAAHLILSSLMSGILEDFWSRVRLTKWSSSGEAIPLKASPGFQSCCTPKIKPFRVCPPCQCIVSAWSDAGLISHTEVSQLRTWYFIPRILRNELCRWSDSIRAEQQWLNFNERC